MTVLFREHRALLTESMETVREIESLEDIRKAVPWVHGTLKCKLYSKEIDHRIGWQTWLITDEQGVVGMTNGEVK